VRAEPRHPHEDPWDHARADDEHQQHEARELHESEGRRGQNRPRSTTGGGIGEGWNDHEDHHGQDVLHDQPSDGHAARRRAHEAVGLQSPHQDDRARDRQGDAEDQGLARRPRGSNSDGEAEQGHERALRENARHRDAADLHQFLDVEVDPDAEHQKDDAHLGKLRRDRKVAHEARGVGPDDDAGQQVPDDRRQAEALRDQPEHPRHEQARSERREERCLVGHASG
jgi:hypothetical protein